MMTFLLIFTVLQTAVNSDFDYSSMACFAIGLAVFLGGCSINPTRSFGPAVVEYIAPAPAVFDATACSPYRTCHDCNSWFRFSPCGAHRLPQMPPSRNLPRSSVSENWTGLALPMPHTSKQAAASNCLEGSEAECRDAVCVRALRNSTVMPWAFT